MDEGTGFRSLTAKEVRKKTERGSEERQPEKRTRTKDSNNDDDKIGSDGGTSKKRYENQRYSDRKYNRERREGSRERYGDSRKSDDSGRDYFAARERSLGRCHSRDRSSDRYSNKDRESYRDHCYKESDTKQRRSDTSSYERNRSNRRNRSSRYYSAEDTDEGNSDRPAWATKAVMKRAEEIQKRKLIWSKPEEKKESECSKTVPLNSSRPSTTATWNSILAASSSDSKQLDKFKRLMGMKKSDEEGQEKVSNVDDSQIEAERKRQLELYSHLDQQYAVARSFTHLSRGQGLGFHQ